MLDVLPSLVGVWRTVIFKLVGSYCTHMNPLGQGCKQDLGDVVSFSGKS